MSVEAPIQIDLSEENSWDKIDDSLLSEEEKETLAAQFAEETEGIISLSREELQNLRYILSSEAPETYNDSLEEFVQSQLEEGVSSHDILGDVLDSTTMDTFDSFSSEALFGENGVFQMYNISSTPRDIMSASLSVAAIRSGNSGEDFSDVYEKIQLLHEVGQAMKPGPGGINTEVPAISIANYGEGNSIFMNVQQGEEFFTKILNGEFTNKEDIINAIESANTYEVPQIDTENVVTEEGEIDTSSIPEGIDGSDTIPEDEIAAVNSPETDPSERQDIIERWKNSDNIILQIFAALLSFGRDINGSPEDTGEDSQNDGIETSEETEAEEVALTLEQQARNTIREKLREGSINSFEVSKILELFPEDGELSDQAKQIIRYINSIPDYEGQADFESKFENLFISKTEDGRVKIDAFIEDGGNRVLEEGVSTGQNLAATLRLYVEYRENGNRAPYTEYFED